MDVRQNGAAKSRAHGSGRSQNVNVNKALDGGKQGHDGSAVIGWSGEEEETVHVRKHERRVVRSRFSRASVTCRVTKAG